MNHENKWTIALASIGLMSVVLGLTVAINWAVYTFDAETLSDPVVHVLPNEGYPIFGLQSVQALLKAHKPLEVWRCIIWTFIFSAGSFALLLLLLAAKYLPKTEKDKGDYGSAHWASSQDIAGSGLLTGKGIVVGALRYRRKVKLLRYDGEGHVIVVSPTRSGKGVTVVVPTALTWPESILFNDIKGELWALTAGWRKSHFNSVCLRFDATCEDGSAVRWNPLFEIRPYPHDVRDAQNIAITLTTSESSAATSENERHWRVMGTRLIKATILHQLYVGKDKSLPGCYNLLTSTERDLEDTLLLMVRTRHDPQLILGWKDAETGRPTPTHPAIAHVARDMLNKSDRERNAIVSAAISHLEPFDDPIMAANVSTSDFSLSDLMHHQDPVSLYLTTPVADLERVQSLHRLFFTLAGTRNTEHLEFREGKPAPRYKHRLLEVFDECAHLGYSPVIEKHFSLASGYGIQGMFVFQDFSQLFSLYGRNESITSNCDVKVAFAPNSIETAEYLSRVLGTETREKKSESGGLLNKQRNKQKHSFGRALLTPDECARLDRDRSIILRNGFPPILADKVPYFEIPELHDRTMLPAPNTDRIPFSGKRWWEKLQVVEQSKRVRSKPSQEKEKSNNRKRKSPPANKDKAGQIELFGR